MTGREKGLVATSLPLTCTSHAASPAYKSHPSERVALPKEQMNNYTLYIQLLSYMAIIHVQNRN